MSVEKISIKKFIKEWTDKFSNLGQTVAGIESRLQQLAQATINQFGTMFANQNVIVESVEHHDLNILALAEVIKGIYFSLEKLKIEQEALVTTTRLITNYDVLEVKKRAEKSFNEDTKIAFQELQAKREVERKVREESKKKVEEAKRIEEELKNSETPALISLKDEGNVTTYPAEATIFGD